MRIDLRGIYLSREGRAFQEPPWLRERESNPRHSMYFALQEERSGAEEIFDCGSTWGGSERWRSVDPDHQGFLFARVVPAMAAITLEPKALVLMEDITFRFIQPDF